MKREEINGWVSVDYELKDMEEHALSVWAVGYGYARIERACSKPQKFSKKTCFSSILIAYFSSKPQLINGKYVEARPIRQGRRVSYVRSELRLVLVH